MATELTGNYVIRLAEVKVELSADETRFGLTLTNTGDRIWKYSLSLIVRWNRVRSAMTGRLMADDAITAAMRVAAMAAQGYQPGTIERGLLDAMTEGDC